MDVLAPELEKAELERKEILKRYRALLRALGPRASQKKKLIREAFEVAIEAHQGTYRKSGEPYIFHPIAVAHIAAHELGLGPSSVACALMHDVVEDSDVTIDDIELRFGPKIARIINGLTKISAVHFEAGSSVQAENFRKMLLTISDDLRVILVKLCDRLHNMRTLESVPRSTQLKIASETLFLYAPLAHRLGLNAVKTELEDLSIKYTDSEKFDEIVQKLAASKSQRSRYVREFIEPLEEKLKQAGLDVFEIKGRPKSIFSILQKMKKQGIPFEQVYDLFAVRIILNSTPQREKEDCWRAFSVITDIYKTQGDRLRDWLTTPKANGYEALHTTVLGPKTKWVEVQIRSKRMDDIAERGLAAHWKYKSSSAAQHTPQDATFDNWLNRVKDMLENKDLSALEFLDDFKFSLLSEEIYVFTPKGEIRNLPLNSTALDFGFDIHSDVGAKCIGAKVNGKLVPISHVLKNGDVVEIITSQKQRVNEDWQDFVVTGKAKSKIRNWLREEKRKKADDGKDILQRKFRNAKVQFNEQMANRVMRYFGKGSLLDLYFEIATGIIAKDSIQLSRILAPREEGAQEEVKPRSGKGNEEGKAYLPGKNDQIIVGDDHELNYSLAKCCNPIPGDPIFGFVTIGEGVKIHRVNCPNAVSLMSNYGYRIIKAEWKHKFNFEKAFLAGLRITGIDDVGIVSRATDIISKELQVNMKSISFGSNAGTFEGTIILYIYDTNHLNNLISKLEKIGSHITVTRIEVG
jgi:GTP diphosphokinase / guanosine-3',5'-bis(diphosphate) 3'-diphosphatase